MNETIARLHADQIGTLPGLLGLEWKDARPGAISGTLKIEGRHLSPNGYLHAATIVALADSACGFGCTISLPPDARNFTTTELKTNFIGTAREGTILCHAKAIHAGRTTQVWDAEVTDERSGKILALFRCTQLMLYDR